MFCFVAVQLLLLQITNAVHHQMSERELHHIFGTRLKREVPEYWLHQPIRKRIDNGEIVRINYAGREEKFLLQPHKDLLTEGFHMVLHNQNGSSIHAVHPDSDCVFRGNSLSQNGTVIAVVGCGTKMRGMIIDGYGNHFLIHPNTRGEEHIIHKRSADMADHSHSCLFNHGDDPFPEDKLAKNIFGGKSSRLAVLMQEELTIELAVFADDAMWRHFTKLYGDEADEEMHRFILSAVNNIDILYSQRSIQPRINVRMVRYEVLKNPPKLMSKRMHKHGDVDMLLDSFCNYQHSINVKDDKHPRHWDHALLFSGYDLYRDGLLTVAGYAPVKGMCSGVRSCTINEGLDFGSVFVVTHEMGHSLGMYHDGDNECDLRCCIMSPSVGTGKTEWSKCSVKELNVFVNNLGKRDRPANCLMDNPQRDSVSGLRYPRDTPGQQFTLDEQCSIFHGECWKHELRDGQELEEVCEMVWCGNGEGIIRTAHPALEGTYCGKGKWCRNGICQSTSRSLMVVAGGWSDWDDQPHKSCAPGCSECEIQGQIRLRRSIRSCNNPSPNNGGNTCRGDDSRGLRCQKELCRGLTPDEYAVDFCTSLRDNPNTPNPQLSGEGMQFEQAKCKIWCQMAHSNHIRTVANYPDGTPCGEEMYCIKGECRLLQCGGFTVVERSTDCVQGIGSDGFSFQKDNQIEEAVVSGKPRSRQNTFAIPKEVPEGMRDEKVRRTTKRTSVTTTVTMTSLETTTIPSSTRSPITTTTTTTTTVTPTTKYVPFAVPLRKHSSNSVLKGMLNDAESLTVMEGTTTFLLLNKTNTENSKRPLHKIQTTSQVIARNGRELQIKDLRPNIIDDDEKSEETTVTTLPFVSVTKEGTIQEGKDRWTSWSEWSKCFGIMCSRPGIQVRVRRCWSGLCTGARRQKKRCQFSCHRENRDLPHPSMVDGSEGVPPAPKASPPEIQSHFGREKSRSHIVDRSAEDNVTKIPFTSSGRKRFIDQSSYEKGPQENYRPTFEEGHIGKTGYFVEEIDPIPDEAVPTTVHTTPKPHITYSRFRPRIPNAPLRAREFSVYESSAHPRMPPANNREYHIQNSQFPQVVHSQPPQQYISPLNEPYSDRPQYQYYNGLHYSTPYVQNPIYRRGSQSSVYNVQNIPRRVPPVFTHQQIRDFHAQSEYSNRRAVPTYGPGNVPQTNSGNSQYQMQREYWGEWSFCTATCGQSLRSRQKYNCHIAPCIEREYCTVPPCSSQMPAYQQIQKKPLRNSADSFVRN